jgi:hypothetical protein
MGNITLDIDLAGTGQIARGLAIAEMGLGQNTKTLNTMSDNPGGLGGDNHSLFGESNTGANQIFLALYLHHTHLTGSIRRFALDMTQGGDGNIRTSGNLKDSEAVFSHNLGAIYGKGYSRHAQVQQ